MRSIPSATQYRAVSPNCLFDLRLKVLTVFYGGGPKAGVLDRLTPFRGTEIRGQLRFWWRATRGAAYADWQRLAVEEANIWGATEQRSPVEVRVMDWRLPRAEPTVRREAARTVREQPGYALFPALEGERERQWICRGGEFRLQVLGEPRLRDDVEAALWAWIAFGGIGARTRRGVGSLFCDDPRFRPGNNLAEWMRNRATQHIGASAPRQSREWPVLAGAHLVVGTRPLDARRGWQECMNFWQVFRQGKPVGSRTRSPRPEADSIRRLCGQHYVDPGNPPHSHAPRLPDGYARAVLGLPIVLAFRRDQSGPSRNQDPQPHIIEPVGEAVRMASPVIVKPIGVGPGMAVPVVLLLNTQAEAGTRQLKVGRADGAGTAKPVDRGSSRFLQDVIRAAAAPSGFNGEVIDL